MGTRSRLGLELSDGSILSIYCHYDGYPEFNGVKLVENFNTLDKVKELIDMGDISCLWTNVGWNQETLGETGPLPYRSRGEDCPPRHDADLCEYLLSINAEEYHYLFRNDKWVCYEINPLGLELPKIIEIPVEVAA